jgi:hypothetical protein
MKKLAFTILSLMLFSAAAINASAQESRQVSGFDAVASGVSCNVHIKIDGTESVKIEASSEFLNEVETIVEDHTLKIRFKDHNRHNHNFGKADVYVSAKALNAITNSGSGSMHVDGTLSGENVSVVLSGSGDMSTAVKAGNLNTVISGSGSIKLNGSSRDADVVISGSGEVEGRSLKTGSAQVTISGSGNVYFDAEKSISAHISGSGNVRYTGNASVNSTHSGSGRVIRD